jgi:hypothetical protein
MRLLSAVSRAVLTLAIAVPLYAQQDQHDQKEGEQGKAAQQEKKAQPEKSANQEKKNAQQQDKNNKQGQKNAQEQDTNNRQENGNAQQHSQKAEPAKQEHRGNGNRIPDDRYRANFGREHSFRVSHNDYDRDRRFQYGGYWFGFVDPWPTNWLYTQDVFVVEIDGVYYLCNPMYPGVNVAIIVNL